VRRTQARAALGGRSNVKANAAVLTSRQRLIAEAFRSLKLAPGKEKLLERAISLWSTMPKFRRSGAPPPAFRSASREASARELQTLAKLAAKLAGHIQHLHMPAIVALANTGLFLGGDRLGLAPQLRRTARAAEDSGLDFVPETGTGKGRPSDTRAHAVGQLLARQFEEITGRLLSPTVPALDPDTYGEFVKLVRRVLGAVGLANNPGIVARAAVLELGSRPSTD
jgi:hypothetical protein